jgi:hypothetical protein
MSPGQFFIDESPRSKIVGRILDLKQELRCHLTTRIVLGFILLADLHFELMSGFHAERQKFTG